MKPDLKKTFQDRWQKNRGRWFLSFGGGALALTALAAVFLNSRDYPKSALTYATFSSTSDVVPTQSEKRTALIFQAQDRVRQMLLGMDGIDDAAVTFEVTFSLPAADQTDQQVSGADVSIQMMPGYELTPELVTSVKYLLAASVPDLEQENVMVIDAATGTEMPDTDAA